MQVFCSINNCSRAIRMAKERFAIPTVLLPEDLANPNLDELSCMTYLSYFSKVGGPGYMATLRRVRSLAQDTEVGNFTVSEIRFRYQYEENWSSKMFQTDWNDGFILCTIVVHLGGTIPNYPHLSTDRIYWIKNLTEGVNSARKLGVEPFLTPEEMADKEVHHLGKFAACLTICVSAWHTGNEGTFRFFFSNYDIRRSFVQP